MPLAIATIALIGAAVPAARAATPAPVLKVSGTTLSWAAISGISSYELATIRNPKTTRNTTYQIVTGTSFKPPAVAGQTVNYGMRANVSGAPWAAEVTITWPAALPPAPVLKVSGTTLSWAAISGVSSYQLATIRNPKTTRNTTYQTVTGTSFNPPTVAGETVGYGLRANVSGAPWAAEVTITWAVVSATTTTTTTTTTPITTTTTTSTTPTTTTTTSTTATTSTASAPPSSGGLVVGLNADVSGWGGNSTLDRLTSVTSSTGAKWLREEFDWATIEPVRGTFDWSYYDHFMLIAAQHGMRMLGVLDVTPTWAGASDNTVPSDPSGYAQYVAAMIGRYGPSGSFWASNPSLRGSAITSWELWNEPYYASNYDPAAYARLVKAAGIAAHAVDPNAKLLLSAEMQSALTNGSWLWWDDALYQAVPDLNNYFDGVAVHPYGHDVTTLNPIVSGQPYGNYNHVQRINDIHNQFIAHGASNKPFWITEAGWSTCTDSSDCVTAAQQASNMSTLFGYIHNDWKSWVQAAFMYRYDDGSSPSTMQGGYGLTYLDGSAKPVLPIFRSEALASS